MIESIKLAAGDFWPYLVVIFIGFLPTEMWRSLAVLLGRGLDENAKILVWVRAVASALLAGVVAKLVLVPSGALALLPLFWRCTALICGVIGFFAFRRNVLAGVLIGEATLITAYHFVL